MSINYPTIDNSLSLSNLSYFPQKKNSFSIERRIVERAMATFKEFDRAWVYSGKSLIVIRNFLNAAAQSCRFFVINCQNFNHSVTQTVTKLKLFSIVSASLNTASIPSQIGKIVNSIKLRDSEGIFLSSLGLSLLGTDIVDSLASFINASRALLSKPTIAWLSAFGTPLTLGLIAQGSISRGIRLNNLNKFYKQLDQVISTVDLTKEPQDIRLSLQKFFEVTMKIENPRTEIKALQEAILERHTNKKIVSLLKELLLWTHERENFSAEDLERLSKVLEDIVGSLEKDRNVQHISLAANFLNLTALLAFYTSIPLVIPYLILVVGFSLRIVAQAYQDFT